MLRHFVRDICRMLYTKLRLKVAKPKNSQLGRVPFEKL